MACGHDALEQRLTMFADRPLPLARFGHLKRRSVRVPQDDVEAFAARKGDVKQLKLGVLGQPMEQGRGSFPDLLEALHREGPEVHVEHHKVVQQHGCWLGVVTESWEVDRIQPRRG